MSRVGCLAMPVTALACGAMYAVDAANALAVRTQVGQVARLPTALAKRSMAQRELHSCRGCRLSTGLSGARAVWQNPGRPPTRRPAHRHGQFMWQADMLQLARYVVACLKAVEAAQP